MISMKLNWPLEKGFVGVKVFYKEHTFAYPQPHKF